MDVMDAGVYVSKWEARVPRHAKMTLWGPLQAREMGLEGWEVQDGGETGFVMHHTGRATLGRATATLVFVRRLERAWLTTYLGGYPADAAPAQRKLDVQSIVSGAELFLKRLAKEPVQFQFQGEIALVDNVNQARVVEAEPTRALGGGRRTGKRAPIIDADTGREESVASRAGVDEVSEKGRSPTRVWEV
jgi:hypothetical protein